MGSSVFRSLPFSTRAAWRGSTLAVLIAGIAACNPGTGLQSSTASPKPTASPATSAGATAQPSASPSGVALAGSPILGQWTKQLDQTGGRLPKGTWRATFDDQGVVFYPPEGNPVYAGGIIQFSADEITFGPDPHCGSGRDTPGRYRWTIRGETLDFERIEDLCFVREELLVSKEWRRRQ